jgi:transmembrane sensor
LPKSGFKFKIRIFIKSVAEMENEKTIREYIRKLFIGRIGSDELKALNEWYDSFDNSEELTVDSDVQDTDGAVKRRILLRILNSIREVKLPVEKGNRIWRTHWKAAASIAFLVAVSSAVLYLTGVFTLKHPESEWLIKTTGMGEKSVISLKDGSKITLNGGSKLRYPEVIGSTGSRDVYLEGEAYFEINHNDSKPFQVHTGEITTTDAGTKFDISAFGGENKISVSLVEGKVKISANDPSAEIKNLDLAPSHQLVYNSKEKRGTVEVFDQESVSGWTKNILIFRKRALSEVMISLERAYGIKFVLADSATGKIKITANFRNDSYKTISEAIKKTTGLDYQMTGEGTGVRSIVFSRKR